MTKPVLYEFESHSESGPESESKPISHAKFSRRWAPPAWWNVDGDVKSLEGYAKIRAAYAKADDCAHCADLRGSNINMSFTLHSLVLSAKDGCAGCLLLLSILRSCGSIRPLKLWYHRSDELLGCWMKVSEMIMMDSGRSSFEVYALPGMTGMYNSVSYTHL